MLNSFVFVLNFAFTWTYMCFSYLALYDKNYRQAVAEMFQAQAQVRLLAKGDLNLIVEFHIYASEVPLIQAN